MARPARGPVATRRNGVQEGSLLGARGIATRTVYRCGDKQTALELNVSRTLPLIATAAAGAALLTGVAACGSSSGTSAATTTPPATTAPATDSMATAMATETAPAATTAPATTAPAHSDGPVVTVTLGSPREFSMKASAVSEPAGHVQFKVVNKGAMTHEVVVIRTNKQAGALPKDKDGLAIETGSVGETGDLAAGKTKTVVFRLTKGHYVLICNLPGHYAGGMYMNFTVK